MSDENSAILEKNLMTHVKSPYYIGYKLRIYNQYFDGFFCKFVFFSQIVI